MMLTNSTKGLMRWLLLGLLMVTFQAAHADLAPPVPPGYTLLESIDYDYDAGGNRIARGATVAGVPESAITASYDAGNRLTQLSLNGETYTLSYDANGNLISKTPQSDPAGATSYGWDPSNQLISIDGPGITARFKYDPLGRRIEKTVNDDTTQYLYDGDQAIAELKNNSITATYLTGLAIDEVIARYTAQGERSQLSDALGSILISSKEDTSVATAYGYSPYGESQTLGTDEGSPVQYTARENDQTGLYYYRARYYDPVLKRFISEDPIGISGGNNVYGYVGGNPVTYGDPSGNCPWCAAAAAGAIGGALFDIMGQLARNGGNLQCIDLTEVGWSALGGAALGVGFKGIQALAQAAKAARAAEAASRGRNLPFKDIDRLSEVNKTLDRIESNGPFPYKKDGAIFRNEQGKLPEGNYREYTVDTPGASSRGARRIVQDSNTGRTYYTDDHYNNFTQISPKK